MEDPQWALAFRGVPLLHKGNPVYASQAHLFRMKAPSFVQAPYGLRSADVTHTGPLLLHGGAAGTQKTWRPHGVGP